MGEGYSATTGFSWGCRGLSSESLWVPFPRDLPRRHPLIDATRRTDDPCLHPRKEPPEYNASPRFKGPREGYPNHLCRLEDYKQEEVPIPQAKAQLVISDGSPTGQKIDIPMVPYFQPCEEEVPKTKVFDINDRKILTGREFVEGKRTGDLYPTSDDLPCRFHFPESYKHNGIEGMNSKHPFYITESNGYGLYPPTPHSMPTAYFPRDTKFTEHLAKTGRNRNRCLNLSTDKTIV